MSAGWSYQNEKDEAVVESYRDALDAAKRDIPALEDPAEQLAAGLRVLGASGLGFGVAGHVSCRHPMHTDRFWVNPLGIDFRDIERENLVLIDHAGNILAGEGPINRSAFQIHSAIHTKLANVAAVAHAHSLYGVAWSTIGLPLSPIQQSACAFFEDHVVIDTFDGHVLAAEQATTIAEAIQQANVKAAILKHHGLITLGRTPSQAVWWLLAMERACQVEIIARSTGLEPSTIPENVARRTACQNGDPTSGDIAMLPYLRHDHRSTRQPR